MGTEDAAGIQPDETDAIIAKLLDAIAAEPVPDRIRDLATQLSRALQEKSRDSET